jgi:hypothetical protein
VNSDLYYVIGLSKYVIFAGKPEVFRFMVYLGGCLLYQPNTDYKATDLWLIT